MGGPRVVVRALGIATAALAWLLVSAPSVATACPACLGTDGRNAAFLKIGSLFVLLPFMVVGLVLYVLRQAPERDAADRRPLLPRS